MAGRLQFDINLGRPAARPAGGARGGPMRLLVVGDFSGRAPAERAPLSERKTWRVDVDNLDRVLAALAPRMDTAAGELAFGSLDDFHPDALYADHALFQALRDARTRPPADGGDLLGSLLGRSAAPAAVQPAAPASDIDAFVRGIVAPYIVPDTSAQTRSYVAAVDAAITEQMRRLLHDPAFQALEAAWRGVQWLISSLELDENLQLHLFDATRDEWLADVIAAHGQIAQSGLHRALADRWRNEPDGAGWSLIAGLHAFGPDDDSIGLLAALGLVASQAGGPFIGAAAPALVDADEAALAGWNALRHSEAAPWLGLAAPRMLLRRPYGKRSDPVDAFAFEEFAGAPAHEDLLWGNPSLAIALLAGRAFMSDGWAGDPADEREIGDLPACTFEIDGERELQPCAERHLGEQAAQQMLARGLMPVASHRHANAVTVMRLQTVAEPATALPIAAGR